MEDPKSSAEASPAADPETNPDASLEFDAEEAEEAR